MLVQCMYCGAPLDVKSGEKLARCSYCERSQKVKGMQTLAMQTPTNWVPPPQWVPPPGAKLQVQSALVFHSVAAPTAAAAVTGWVGLIIAVTTILPIVLAVGIALFTSGPFAAGLDEDDPPTLAAVVVPPAGLPLRDFSGVTSGTVSVPGQFGQYSSAPQLVLTLSSTQLVTLTATSQRDPVLLVRRPSGVMSYDDDGGDGRDARLALGLAAGTYQVWVGDREEGTAFAVRLSAQPIASLPGADGLVYGGPPIAASVALGEGVEPMRWQTVVVPAVATSHCGSHVPAVPHLLVSTPEPRLVTLRAHADFDSTLLVRDAAGVFACDDDSGPSNDAMIERLLPAGTSAVWVGARIDSASGAATVALEPHARGEQAQPAMIAPELPATAAIVDLDEMARRHMRSTTAAGTVTGRLATSELQSGCPGYVQAAPTVTLRTTETATVTVRASGPEDLVLLARTASGGVACNDDWRGRDPRLELPLSPGEHDVWVGTLRGSARSPFRLTTELER